MKIAKAFAILLAMVLVVLCFNAPFVYSFEDEDPWDGEDNDNGGGTDGGGSQGDSTGVDDNIFKPLYSGDGSGGGLNSSSDFADFMSVVCFIFWHRDLPGTE